jgi:hypothetical protein
MSDTALKPQGTQPENEGQCKEMEKKQSFFSSSQPSLLTILSVGMG